MIVTATTRSPTSLTRLWTFGIWPSSNHGGEFDRQRRIRSTKNGVELCPNGKLYSITFSIKLMFTLPSEVSEVLSPFQVLFKQQRSWHKAQQMLVGAILGRGKPTVSRVLETLGLAQCKQYSNYYYSRPLQLPNRSPFQRLPNGTIPHRHHWLHPKPVEHTRRVMRKILTFDRIGHQNIKSHR